MATASSSEACGWPPLKHPGTRPESISILVYDRAVSDSIPHAVLTGDTLFVGDVGRPDLRAALGWSANDLGGLLYDSLHNKLLALPDSSLVYPAHGAGSLCGKALSKETVSTIGEQRRTNYALQPLTKEAFIDLVTADQPDAPSYFTYDAVLNSRKRQTLTEALTWELRPLSLDDCLELQKHGVQLLDTRDAGEFAAAHLRGAINIGLRGWYATWAGSLLDRERPIVIVADPGGETGIRASPWPDRLRPRDRVSRRRHGERRRPAGCRVGNDACEPGACGRTTRRECDAQTD